MRRWFLFLFVLGCDQRPPAELPVQRAAPAFKASCTIPSLSVCTEYTEVSFTLGEEVLKSACQGSHGTWSPARCSPTRRLGSCTLSGSQRVYYPGFPGTQSLGTASPRREMARDFSAVTAAKDCTELYQGTWAANRSPH